MQLLVREAVPHADWEYLADVLMASLRADHVHYLRRIRELPDDRLAAGWADLVRRLLSYP